MFQDKYPHDKIPSTSTIQDLYTKWRAKDSIIDVKKNKRPTERIPTVVDRIRTNEMRSPQKSIRGLSQQVGVSRNTCHRVLPTNLKFRPFRVSVVHELQEPDKGNRVTHCNWLLSSIVEGFLNPITYSSFWQMKPGIICLDM
ncbi:hypothetical protein C0J52_24490 [Blattella germanica]|nr:hypothetical protein C0J52_24490 [Blattella germanica]